MLIFAGEPLSFIGIARRFIILGPPLTVLFTNCEDGLFFKRFTLSRGRGERLRGNWGEITTTFCG